MGQFLFWLVIIYIVICLPVVLSERRKTLRRRKVLAEQQKRQVQDELNSILLDKTIDQQRQEVEAIRRLMDTKPKK